MQVSAAAPIREHEKPMSWARAVLIATGFFFLTAILIGQLPSYIFTISTLATLARFEQGTLALSLLAIGFGVIALEIAFLYDPKPLIPWPLFALVGAGITAIGAFFVYQVMVGISGTSVITGKPGWFEFLPGDIRNPAGAHIRYWPVDGQAYLFHQAWFQPGSIDIAAVGYIALLIGLGMFFIAVLNPFVLSGRLVGPTRDLIVRFSLGLSFVIIALYLSILTFTPETLQPKGDTLHGPAGNVVLFFALGLALFGTIVWLLPVMTTNRQRFMPANYLHGVVGLLGFVGVPLLIVWALVYPVVNFVHGIDSNQVWVQCSQKTEIPTSCSFTPFTGYIICAIVFSMTFGLLIAGLFFWSSRRDMVVLGGTYGLIYVALAATVVHVDDPLQLAIGMIIATSIVIVAFVWTWGTQREFAPTSAQQLGCTGQWLVLGTLLLIYLFGFAVFSLPSFFEIEALALVYLPGANLLHDAFWGLLLMGGLAGFQMTLLIRRKPMSNLRKFAMWTMLVAVALMMVGAIQGFHNNVLDQGINAMEGGHAVFVAGICFEIVGIATCLYGAWRASSIPWMVAIGALALVALAFGIVIYNLPNPYPELIVAAFIVAMVGAFAYTAAGPDEELEYAEANGGAESFVVTR
ncbi:MAG: hypothetical protein OJF49_003329 [Ktedonobacterales bacterium]|jgi:hypothetical protein|nr:MAG: hypothetical protein OJF49_003329 [Ktedonobacterales bacterium]